MRERTAVLAIDLARHAKLLFDERELLGVILVLLIPRRHDASQRRQMATAALEFGSPDLLEHLPEHLLCGLGVAAVQCAAQAELREYPVVQAGIITPFVPPGRRTDLFDRRLGSPQGPADTIGSAASRESGLR